MEIPVNVTDSLISSETVDFTVRGAFLINEISDLSTDELSQKNILGFPYANIVEDAEDYAIELIAPGFQKEDFRMEIDDNILNISAQKQEEICLDDRCFKRREFYFNSFSRSFKLPRNIEFNMITGEYENGILKLIFPKIEIPSFNPKKEFFVS